MSSSAAVGRRPYGTRVGLELEALELKPPTGGGGDTRDSSGTDEFVQTNATQTVVGIGSEEARSGLRE